MCIWDGATDQPFWEREALQLAEEYEPDEIDLAPGTEPPPNLEVEGPHEPPMRVLQDLRSKTQTLWDQIQELLRPVRKMMRLRTASLVGLTILGPWVCSAAAQTMVSITRLSPDSTVRATWERVVSCAGPTRDTTQTFEQIKFYERDTLPRPHGEPVLQGQWIAPDTIYITKGFVHDGWVVAHEMLHHALNGPPGEIKHPIEPFLYPCGLYLKAEPPAVAVAPAVNPPGEHISAEPSPYYRYRVADPLTNRLREPGL